MSYLKSSVLFFIVSILVTISFAQKPVRLPVKFSDNWKAVGELRNITSEFKTPVYSEYGLKSVFSRQYSNKKDKIVIEAFETEFTSQAFGLMTFERSRGKVGTYQNGRYFFRTTPWDENISQQNHKQRKFHLRRENLHNFGDNANEDPQLASSK